MRIHEGIIVSSLIVALQAVGANATLRQFHFTVHSASRSPDGFKREVYLINGQQPGPLVDVDEGDDVEIFVQNDLSVETTVHWHGLLQRGTPHMDGVPGVTQDPIRPGGNFTYRFSTASEYGFFWYHSHFRAYYNDAIRGPLLIRPAASRQRPFETIARNNNERTALLEAERQATNILLNDWTHEPSDVIFARYNKTGAFPSCVDSILANGLGRVQCLPESVLQLGPGLGLEPHSQDKPGQRPTVSDMPRMSGMPNIEVFEEREMHDVTMDTTTNGMATQLSSTMSMDHSSLAPTSSDTPNMPNMDTLSPRGCMPPMMFKPGFNMSSLPPEMCSNTSSPLLVIPADPLRGWLALNLVNSGAVSALRVSLDGHSMLVYAADGLYVKPQKIQVLHMELGQRYSIMVKLDQRPGKYYLRFATYPSGDMQQVLEGRAVVSYSVGQNSANNIMEDPAMTWMLINGSAKASAARLDPTELSPSEKNNSPPSGPADKTLSFAISQTDVVTWVIDQAPFKEPDVPLIYGNISSGWSSATTVHLPFNSTVDIILNISNRSMDKMGHPLHLHGHKFWVLGSGKGSFPYNAITDAPAGLLNLRNPPYRDTTGLPSKGWAAIRYVTDNPGAWIFHCHLQWHIAVGMAVVLVEGGDQLPALVGRYNTTANTDKSGAMAPIACSSGCSLLLAAILVSIVATLY